MFLNMGIEKKIISSNLPPKLVNFPILTKRINPCMNVSWCLTVAKSEFPSRRRWRAGNKCYLTPLELRHLLWDENSPIFQPILSFHVSPFPFSYREHLNLIDFMDPVRMQKFPAIERCRKAGRGSTSEFLPSLTQLSKVLFVGLFLSAPLWLPHVRRSCRVPKYLFLLCNIVIVFCLAGESKLSCSSPTTDIYDEYMKASSEVRAEGKGEKRSAAAGVSSVQEEVEEEEEEGWNEIDKKAEDFIARINWQRN